MSETEQRPGRVGVRELRQNLSVYLDRVKRGETLDVTERGNVVAELRPKPEEALSPLERMIREGRATRAKGSLADLPPPLPPLPGKSLSEILLEMREEDDR